MQGVEGKEEGGGGGGGGRGGGRKTGGGGGGAQSDPKQGIEGVMRKLVPQFAHGCPNAMEKRAPRIGRIIH
uniref:Uncharacterized protein n=1 Tax=Heterorhabditis bacteriophora TaxID=37862 RepID=A0A1I7XK76_HETBA